MDFGQTVTQRRLAERAEKDAQFFTSTASAFAGLNDWDAAADRGWMGLSTSSSLYMETTTLDAVIGYEALGRAGAARGALFSAGAHLFGATKAIERFGSESQKAEWLAPLAAGRKVGALALTEPSGGSSFETLETTLEEEAEGKLHLTGSKTYVTNATSADVFLVLARHPAASSPMNNSVLAVPARSPGVEVQKIPNGRGLKGADMGHVIFSKCPVEDAQILGSKGAGLAVVLGMMQQERSCILAGSLGALVRDFDAVVTYLRDRRDNDGSVLRHQALSHELVDLHVQIEIARQTLYRAAWEIDAGRDNLKWPALSKLAIARTLLDCTQRLRQVMAGAGWDNRLALAEAVDDAFAVMAASGTADVQRNMIASHLRLGSGS